MNLMNGRGGRTCSRIRNAIVYHKKSCWPLVVRVCGYAKKMRDGYEPGLIIAVNRLIYFYAYMWHRSGQIRCEVITRPLNVLRPRGCEWHAWRMHHLCMAHAILGAFIILIARSFSKEYSNARPLLTHRPRLYRGPRPNSIAGLIQEGNSYISAIVFTFFSQADHSSLRMNHTVRNKPPF